MQVSALYRHPLKSHGREALDAVTLTQGQAMPFDRLWAVAHDRSKADGSEWVPCVNFSIGSKAPALMAINAVMDEETGLLTLRHPARPDLTINPDTDSDALIDWVRPLVPDNRALPARILRLEHRGFTDTEYPSVSLCNMATHKAVAAEAGKPLSPLRWRGNIWFDGAEAWEENGWLGRDVALGKAKLRVIEPIERCLATAANPEIGQRDVDTLAVLNRMKNQQNFGIYAQVIQTGEVALGDSLRLL
ncbi:hypothetical protein SAMN04488523_101429 [Sulfitobacter brevis]|uniref:MOSC domain-containing protein n=1 Tax=Sulfitobacter brevis TaxID=74348 RepID=A0A1I1TQ47_9RHOB|nr:MOSC N-terminal beta barrel domain-containing protein [Sulfitobacter brevis]SFD59328.1 hypothetical protein SAMN04488523_101429 [Sulfitobacter brevis]